MKRAKRRYAPIFVSSHTMHLLNQKKTNLRKFSKNWTFLLSLKQRELNKSLNESIDLNKQIFNGKFNLSCSSHCFKLLRTLGFSQSLPSVMSYSGVSLSLCPLALRPQMVLIHSLFPFFLPKLNTMFQLLVNFCQSCV